MQQTQYSTVLMHVLSYSAVYNNVTGIIFHYCTICS